MRRSLALALTLVLPAVAQAQDTTAREGVRVGITYRPGTRPGVAVLPGATGLDSLRALVLRDLDYSDLFEVIALPGTDSMASTAGRALNYPLYRALGADFAVEVLGTAEDARLAIHSVSGGALVRDLAAGGLDLSRPDDRLRAHRLTDEIVELTVGTPGIAATRLLFVQGRRIFQVDADGAAVRAVSPSSVKALSPVWAPDGRRFAYMALEEDGQGRLFELAVGSDRPELVFSTGTGLNMTPEYAPDGNGLAFARAVDGQTDLFLVRTRDACCLQRLTVGRFADNLSPAFSPDGSRVAFVSTRPGLPQLYVMAADGTGQELFAPFDYGVTGASYAPAWSPDGQRVTFHRIVEGTPQLFVLDVRTRSARQLTSTGRNEDATWAPDSRHIAFVSNRTGSRQLWVIDLETGRVRQLTRVGATRLPAWSPRLAAADLTTP
jgi:TolB protein